MSILYCTISKYINKRVAVWCVKAELPPADLGATEMMNKTLQLLQDSLSSHDSAVLPLDARKQGLVQVWHLSLAPLPSVHYTDVSFLCACLRFYNAQYCCCIFS